MGTFFHQLTLIGPSGATETLEALVDTGAMFTTVPAPILERLGVRPFDTIAVRFANGSVEQWRPGHVEMELDGRRRPVLCLFGSADAPALIGAHALEAFLLTLGPVEEKLVPKEAYLMWAPRESHTLLAGLPWRAAAPRTCTSMEAAGRLLGACDCNSKGRHELGIRWRGICKRSR